MMAHMRPGAWTPLALVVAASLAAADDTEKGLKTIRAADIQKHQVFLSSDALEGREAGSEGGHKAALYIAEQIRRLGLQPGGRGGAWFQPFGEGGAAGPLEDANFLSVPKDAKASEVYKLGAGVMPHRRSGSGSASAPVVFAGYGIKSAAWDDYAAAKVKGAVALILDHGPGEKEGKIPPGMEEKVGWAQAAGAEALLVALDPANHDERGLPAREEFAWPPASEGTPFRIPVVYCSRDAAEAVAKMAGKDLKASQLEMDRAQKPRTWKSTRAVQVSVSPTGIPGKGTKNIVAVWPGTDEKLRGEYVVAGAHYDHVGRGLKGSNVQAGGKPGEIHNGADDNASGTSALLDIAEAVSQCAFKRTVVLVWFDAEENGLVGSQHFAANPTFPIGSCVAMLNCDMIGRNDIQKVYCGIENDASGAPKYPRWAALLKEAERKLNVTFDYSLGGGDLLKRSDQWSFMQAGVPAAFLFGGLHADYHTERDDVERINFPKQERVGRIAFFVLSKSANAPSGFK